MSVFDGLAVTMLARIARDHGLIPHSGTEFFGLCHIFHPLLHLVANVISKLKMHEDMLSPWWVNVTAISGLSDLAVMMLNQIVRGQGLIACLGTEFFWNGVTYLNHCYITNPLNAELTKKFQYFWRLPEKFITTLKLLKFFKFTVVWHK